MEANLSGCGDGGGITTIGEMAYFNNISTTIGGAAMGLDNEFNMTPRLQELLYHPQQVQQVS